MFKLFQKQPVGYITIYEENITKMYNNLYINTRISVHMYTVLM